MLHRLSYDSDSEKVKIPAVVSIYDDFDIPKYELRKDSIPADVAYRLVKNELLDEGNARLNLATFCSTYMEDEALKLMADTLEKNAIDKSEYPSTIELENRCVNIIASLWNADKKGNYVGTSTAGSSEACMLGALAMKFRWKDRAIKLGVDIQKKKPNIIISSGYQVCWEKFCVYWDVELRTVPIDPKNMSLNTKKAINLIDEYTIGIVGILGHTYTGKFDDIKALDEALKEYNNHTKHKVNMHVDAASGGLYLPFINPELEWDFRLENVISINTSGHKYGLVYPGVGWIIWRDKDYLPDELVFEVSYLGGFMPTMAINFSRSASQIIGQYYCFLRFGFEGYKKVHTHTQNIARYLAQEVEKTGLFTIYNNGESLPVICYKLKEGAQVKWTLYDLSDRLEMQGWQVPVYPLPSNMNNEIVSRIVCRSELSLNLAERFVDDFKLAIDDLTNARIIFSHANPHDVKGFNH